MNAGGDARLEQLAARDFRNLAHVELHVPLGGFALVGDNGQGKSNLLEAIYYLQILRSARGARDQDLIRFGAEAFHIAATVCTDVRHDIGAGFERATKRKRVRVDGVESPRLADALGSLPSVMFSPSDVELVAGSPGARRRFLDIMLALTERGYLSALQHYRGALSRRNAALRSAARASRVNEDAIAVWEPALAEHGARLVAARRAWVASIEEALAGLCGEIGERARVGIRYASGLAPTEALADALAASLAQKRGGDIRRGITQVGPHRDDLGFTIDGRELRTFGSAGQQRSVAIVLRLLEARTFRERTGRAPVLLFDDPFAELDVGRASRILGLLSTAAGRLGQIVLAVPRESDIPRELTGLDRFEISNGVVTSEAA